MRGGVFRYELVEESRGFVALRIDDKDGILHNESGGHRWQRIPPTEKRGRVHTSTITVCVLDEPGSHELYLSDNDLEWQTTRGSGPGGQHRNKKETAVVVTHRPTGLRVRCESERSQYQNRESALTLLRAKLWEQQKKKQHAQRSADRRSQVGSGMRGDKRRTIRTQDGSVVDHATGRRWSYTDYISGNW